MRGGFGGKGGSISSRTIGKQDVCDRASNSENLIRHIAGDDLMVWLDANDIVALNDGDGIQTWPAKYGNEPVQSDSLLRPTYKTSSFNGYSCVNFTGTDIMKWGAPNYLYNGTTSESTILSVTQTNVSGSGQRTILEFSSAWWSSDGVIQSYGTSNRLNAGVGSQEESDPNEATVRVCGPNLYNAFVSCQQRAPGGGNANIALYVNSEPAPVVSETSTDSADESRWNAYTIHLGARQGGTLSLEGDIREFLILKRCLNEGEAFRVSKAAMKRSKITNRYSDYSLPS